MAAFTSEWRPEWNRNSGRLRVGIGGRLQIGMTGRLRRNPRHQRDRAGRSATPLGHWLCGLQARPITFVVALANKLARIAWAVLRTGRKHEAGATAAG